MGGLGDLKLKVRNDGDTADVFVVDNTGLVVGSKLGLGISNPSNPIHLHLAAQPFGTKLFYAPAGIVLSNADTSVYADFLVADSTGLAGNKATVRGVRARGTLADPTVPLTDDVVFAINGGIWDGTKIYNSAEISLKVDGPVSTSVAPQRIVFSTRTNGAGVYVEKMVIKSDGRIQFKGQPAAPARTDACTPGDTIWTGGYLYFCIASGNWGRATFAAY